MDNQYTFFWQDLIEKNVLRYVLSCAASKEQAVHFKKIMLAYLVIFKEVQYGHCIVSIDHLAEQSKVQ